MGILAHIGRRSDDALHVERVDDATWERSLEGFADANLRQVPAFARACAARHGAEVETVLVRDGRAIIGGACVRIRRAPLLGGIAYAAGGPLVRRHGAESATTAEALRRCLRALRQEYARRRGLLLRATPEIPAPHDHEPVARVYADAGFAARGDGERTILLDLRREPDVIRAGFRQKWRNGLHRAERELTSGAFTIEAGDDERLLHAFVRLHEHLLLRKGFGVELDAAFYRRVQQELRGAARLAVQMAFADGQPVAGHVAAHLGDRTLYVLGASTPTGHAVKASYLLQWRAIEAGCRRGSRWYDLGGIDPESNPGVCHFKRGLGGIEVTEPGPFEAAPSAIKAQILRESERIFRARRRAA